MAAVQQTSVAGVQQLCPADFSEVGRDLPLQASNSPGGAKQSGVGML